jgi:hypothetical protein
MQWLSVVLGVSKRTENDFSVSYIGGYDHEATFSVMLMTCAVIAMFATRMNKTVKTLTILVCIVGIYLANYRTTMLAVAPLLLAYFGFAPVQKVAVRDRPWVLSALMVFLCIVLGIAGLFMAERFSDLGLVASGRMDFFKPPYAYTEAESRVLSGRPLIWSQYIYAWMNGDGMTHLFGFGPDSWSKSFRAYAHNTLVNTLYENGVAGVLAVLFTWFFMLAAALRVRHPNKTRLLAAHVGFLLLNMGTMPMWMIEGNALYGIICGYTLYLLSAPQTHPAAARVRRRPVAPAPRPQPAPVAPTPSPAGGGAGGDTRPAA